VHGLSLNDLVILTALVTAPAGRLRRINLAARLGITASAVTRPLVPREKVGLVDRESDPRDARSALATLTPAGTERARTPRSPPPRSPSSCWATDCPLPRWPP